MATIRKILLASIPLCLVFFGVAVQGVTSVHAAALNYTADTTFPITASGVNFIMKAGSSADSLTVNATSLVIAVTSGTSSSTLTSASVDFVISGTATITKTCSGGISQVVITGTGTATLTSAGSLSCPQPGGTGGSASYVYSGGGGGGGGGPPTPPAPVVVTSTVATSTATSTIVLQTTTSTTQAATISPQDQLNALLAQLQALQAQASRQGPSQKFTKFTKNLSLWSRGGAVVSLQQFLIAQDSGSAARKLKNHGVSRVFGPLTYAALVEYQKHVGITPASGYFGLKTRAYINSLLGQ